MGRPQLIESALELVAVPSVSRSESQLASLIERQLREVSDLAVERVGDNLVARSALGRPRRVILAGHIDTVPPFDERHGGIEGDTLWGLGAVDMKGGLAVMLELSRHVLEMSVDVTFVFYACEEIERSASGLGRLLRERPELLKADAAVLAEPTGCVVEAGCQGTVRAVVSMAGRRAHTARPQMGVNAVHRMEPLLRCLVGYEPRELVVEGCSYTEQLQAVAVSGGVAGNVVPDRAQVTVNFRFAPDRDVDAAEEELRRLLAPGVDLGSGDRVEVVDAAPAAAPSLSSPLLAGLVEATGRPPRAKVGWTDVATFGQCGLPAANFGPGDPLLAHTPEEHVSGSELETAYEVLTRFLSAAN